MAEINKRIRGEIKLLKFILDVMKEMLEKRNPGTWKDNLTFVKPKWRNITV